MEYRQITYEITDQIARIGFGKYSKKPMTTLELETLEELKPIFKEIEQRQEKDIIGLIFFSHKKHVFLAGMNVNVIRDLKSVQEGVDGARDGQELCGQIEDLRIPTIACVDGVCMGGGLELALACKAIVASDSPYTSLGAPEVVLGLLPAFGGSYRLPRRIDLPSALDLMLSGRMVKGKAAKEMGLVDDIYSQESLVDKAISEYILGSKKKGIPKAPAQSAEMADTLTQETIFKKARESILRTTKGHYVTPLRILDLLESVLGSPRSAHLEKEALLLGELAVSEQSRNLQSVYYLHANSQKYEGPVGDKSRSPLRRGAVVGAGAMGGGIAWLMAKNDMTPVLKDVNKIGLESGLKQSETIFSQALKRKMIDKDAAYKKQASIKPQLDYHRFEGIDLVVEAVDEEKEIKKRVLSEIENEVSDDCLITSATSSLSVKELADLLAKPSRFAGLHFSCPINTATLVEIVTHDQIAPETISALHAWAVRVKKVPVVVKDGPGFLVNRILTPFINEALYLLDEGVPIDELERACLNFGMPRGPCHLLDEVGIDIGHRLVSILNSAIGDRFKPATIYDKLSTLDYCGKKCKKGFFHYDDHGRKLELNEEIIELLPAQQVKIGEEDIQKRVFFPMINEAATVLQDQIVKTVEEVDLGLIFGIGFPRFRGGLLKYADSQGLTNILKVLDQYAEDLDAKRFEACSLIRELAKKNKGFYV